MVVELFFILFYFIYSNPIFLLFASSQIKALEYDNSSVVNEVHDELNDEGGDDGGNEGGDESRLNMVVLWDEISELNFDNNASDGEYSVFQFGSDVSSCLSLTMKLFCIFSIWYLF